MSHVEPYKALPFTPIPKHEVPKYQNQILGVSMEIKEEVLEYMPKVYVAINTCESHFIHYDKDGKVKRGKRNKNGTYDYGWPQINSIHEKEAEVMGFTLQTMTPLQALKLAQKIYNYSGPTAWSCYNG